MIGTAVILGIVLGVQFDKGKEPASVPTWIYLIALFFFYTGVVLYKPSVIPSMDIAWYGFLATCCGFTVILLSGFVVFIFIEFVRWYSKKTTPYQ